MSAPLVIALADAVVAELNARSWSVTFEAARCVLPEAELKDLAALRVTVVPRSQECGRLSRREMSRHVVIDVAIQHRLAGDIDELMPLDAILVDELLRHFLCRRLADPPAVCIAAGNAPIYSSEHLREMGLLTTVVSLTFQTAEATAEAPKKPEEEPEEP